MATYEIIIKDQTTRSADGTARKSPVAGSGASNQSTTAPSSSGAGSLRQGGVKALVAFNSYVKPFTDRIITQHISTISMKTGAQELEDQMSLKASLIQKGVGLAESAIIGALIGNVPGAVIGVVMNLATTAIDYGYKYEKLTIQRNVEDIGLRFMNARAGGSVAAFSGSRMKNQ